MGAVAPTASEVAGISALLDRELTAHSDATENAIAVSFLEHLNVEPFFAQLWPLLGPALRREYERQESVRGPA